MPGGVSYDIHSVFSVSDAIIEYMLITELGQDAFLDRLFFTCQIK